MFILTVILSEIVAANIVAACSIPFRNFGGAAIAAASNKRSIVIPPDVSATTAPAVLLWETLLCDVDTAKPCQESPGGMTIAVPGARLPDGTTDVTPAVVIV